VNRALEIAPTWLRTALGLAAYAGLRMGEARALEVRDIDLAGDRILVRRAFSEDQVLSPKSSHERVVPLLPELRSILAEASRNKLPAARLVTDPRGRTPNRQGVLSALRALQNRHGLPPRSFHSFRHYFCTMLVRGGAPVEAVRRLAGHSNLATTQRYVHADDEDLRAAIGRLTGNWRETRRASEM
jgi:integrase